MTRPRRAGRGRSGGCGGAIGPERPRPFRGKNCRTLSAPPPEPKRPVRHRPAPPPPPGNSASKADAPSSANQSAGGVHRSSRGCPHPRGALRSPPLQAAREVGARGGVDRCRKTPAHPVDGDWPQRQKKPLRSTSRSSSPDKKNPLAGDRPSVGGARGGFRGGRPPGSPPSRAVSHLHRHPEGLSV